MRQRSPLQIVVLAMGVMSTLALLWLWQIDRPPSDIQDDARGTTKRAVLLPAAVSAAPASVPEISPAARALLAALQRALNTGDAREREVLLSFTDAAALQRFLERARRNGLSVLDQSPSLRTARVRYDSVRSLQSELTENASEFADVSANALFGIPQPPARQDRADFDHVPFGNDTLAYLGATADRTNWGRGVTIAILDTGVAADRTFAANQLRALDLGLGTTPGRGPNDGHGTSVAALAAGMSADAAGVAPAANVLSIRVTDANGLSDLFTISQAIVAAVDAGARVINVSLGGYTTGPMLNAAIGYASHQGAVIVAAAGNDQAAQLAWPAADSRVVSVGAIDRAEQQVTFSNAGEQLQFTAPGYGVQTAWLDSQRAYVNGTSASAPIVAGAIAAVMSQNSNLTPNQAVELLARTANDGGAPGTDPAYGRGIVNLGTAMNSGNPSYLDTAISSHHYDAAANQMWFTVQNRSGRSVTGMSLNVQAGNTMTTQTIPTLAPGETFVAKTPVSQSALNTTGSLAFSTTLSNPLGMIDQVPDNNRKATVLTAPKQ